ALARGTTLVSLRDHGWRLHQNGELLQAPAATVSDDARELGPQDLVVLALKSQVLPALAPSLAPLLAAGTIVMPAMSGVPWWFAAGVAGGGSKPLEGGGHGGGLGAGRP